jgi:T3SS negative regulator,GrlR
VSENGLWTVNFFGNGAAGSGVVVLVNGSAMGGDRNYYYSGKYTINHNQLRADLQVTHFNGELINIFGPLRSLQLIIEGAAGENLIIGQGFDPAASHRRISIKMQRVERLST